MDYGLEMQHAQTDSLFAIPLYLSVERAQCLYRHEYLFIKENIYRKNCRY